MAEIRDFIETSTASVVAADDRSIYRSLRRFHGNGLISFSELATNRGRSLKAFELSNIGISTTNDFLKRNILPLFNLESMIRESIK